MRSFRVRTCNNKMRFPHVRDQRQSAAAAESYRIAMPIHRYDNRFACVGLHQQMIVATAVHGVMSRGGLADQVNFDKQPLGVKISKPRPEYCTKYSQQKRYAVSNALHTDIYCDESDALAIRRSNGKQASTEKACPFKADTPSDSFSHQKIHRPHIARKRF